MHVIVHHVNMFVVFKQTNIVKQYDIIQYNQCITDARVPHFQKNDA